MSAAGSRIMLTGTSGVIGRKLLPLLLEQGHTVISIDREPLPDEVAHLGVDHREEDLSTMDLGSVIADGTDAVIHLAASFERSQESPEYWERGWRDDVLASHRVIDVVRGAHRVKTFVFASSYLVYDPRGYLHAAPGASASLDEQSPLLPRNLCGAGKLYTERELAYVRETTRSDLRVVNARIFRAYGQGSRDVISRWVRAGLRGEQIEVYNPENVFDYVYSGDVADVLAELLAKSDANGAYNVGTGTGTAIRDVITALVEEGVVHESQVIHRESAPPYESSIADVAALRAALGATPGTDIRAGLHRLAEYEGGR